MKKYLLLLALLLILFILPSPAMAADIAVLIDGEALDCGGQQPVIVEGRVLAPLRAVFEALGATVEWEPQSKTAVSTRGDITVKIQRDNKQLLKATTPQPVEADFTVVELDVPALIINDRLMVPVRAISESFGLTVAWDAEDRRVLITSPAIRELTVEPPADWAQLDIRDMFISFAFPTADLASGAVRGGANVIQCSFFWDQDAPDNAELSLTGDPAKGWRLSYTDKGKQRQIDSFIAVNLRLSDFTYEGWDTEPEQLSVNGRPCSMLSFTAEDGYVSRAIFMELGSLRFELSCGSPEALAPDFEQYLYYIAATLESSW